MRKLLPAMVLAIIALGVAPARAERISDYYNFSGGEYGYSGWNRDYSASYRKYDSQICLDLDFMQLCYNEDENIRYNEYWRERHNREQRRVRESERHLRRQEDLDNTYWRGPTGDIYDNRGILICRARRTCTLHN